MLLDWVSAGTEDSGAGGEENSGEDDRGAKTVGEIVSCPESWHHCLSVEWEDREREGQGGSKWSWNLELGKRVEARSV